MTVWTVYYLDAAYVMDDGALELMIISTSLASVLPGGQEAAWGGQWRRRSLFTPLIQPLSHHQFDGGHIGVY